VCLGVEEIGIDQCGKQHSNVELGTVFVRDKGRFGNLFGDFPQLLLEPFYEYRYPLIRPIC